MTSDEGSIERFEKRGKKALEEARAEILMSRYDGGLVSSAVKYFAKTTLRRALPVFPALVSLSCEAVGGKPQNAEGISVALTLMAGAADIHDDIIDKSVKKYSKKTVLGKYGPDVGLLAGDALLIQGLTLLQRECENLPEKQKRGILSTIMETFYEISKAESMEAKFRGKLDTAPRKYLKIINLKAAVPEAHCKIGAILGNADDSTVFKMGKIGKTFGTISLIVEEFADLFDFKELQNRMVNEVPPLPLLQVVQDPQMKTEIARMLSDIDRYEARLKKVAQLVLESEEAKKIFEKTKLKAQSEVTRLAFIADRKIRNEFSFLLLKPIGSLQDSLRAQSRL